MSKDDKTWACSHCNCDRDNIKSNLCGGKFCWHDSECHSGKCLNSYCTLDTTTDDTCTTNQWDGCGKCGSVQCNDYTQCKFTSCLKSDGGICNSCECDRNIS